MTDEEDWLYVEGTEDNGGPHIVQEKYRSLGVINGWHATDCYDCGRSICKYINAFMALTKDLHDVLHDMLLMDRKNVEAIQAVVVRYAALVNREEPS